MNHNIQIPKPIVTFFSAVQQQIDSEATIAGGFVRDVALGKPYKDVDIYVNSEISPAATRRKYNLNFWLDFVNQFPNNRFDFVREASNDGSNSGHARMNEHVIGVNNNEKIHSVWEIRRFDTLFQIITVNVPPIKHIEDYFDIGLCKCFWNKKQLRFYPDFMTDMKNQTLTIVGKDMSYSAFTHSKNIHAENIRKKYPTFKVVVGENNQKFVNSIEDQDLFPITF